MAGSVGEFRDVVLHTRTDTQDHLDTVLDAHLLPSGGTLRTRLKESLAIASSRTQSASPVVDQLISDDAPHCNGLTAQLAVCRVYDSRQEKTLAPRFLVHGELLEPFARAFWQFSRGLLVSRDHPSAEQADVLRGTVDHLFGQLSGSQPLDEPNTLTLANKEPLLMGRSHPEMLLRNHPAEPGARQRIRTRDVSLHARTREGMGAWETYHVGIFHVALPASFPIVVSRREGDNFVSDSGRDRQHAGVHQSLPIFS